MRYISSAIVAGVGTIILSILLTFLLSSSHLLIALFSQPTVAFFLVILPLTLKIVYLLGFVVLSSRLLLPGLHSSSALLICVVAARIPIYFAIIFGPAYLPTLITFIDTLAIFIESICGVLFGFGLMKLNSRTGRLAEFAGITTIGLHVSYIIPSITVYAIGVLTVISTVAGVSILLALSDSRQRWHQGRDASTADR